MSAFIKPYLTALIIMTLLDSLWLLVIAKQLYATHIGHLFRPDPMWWAVGLFYLLYVGAIVVFVVIPSAGSVTKALVLGALLGFTAYMTYDLVNLATLKDWSLTVVFVDIAWGTFITACASGTAVWIARIV
jgi:uncharacterized membrane protein